MVHLPCSCGVSAVCGTYTEAKTIPIVFPQIGSSATQSAACPAAIFNIGWIQLAIRLFPPSSLSFFCFQL